MELTINTKDHSYPIVFYNSFDHLPDMLNKINLSSKKIIIITDSNVDMLYGEQVIKTLSSRSQTVIKYAIAAGEDSKHLGTVEKIYSFCLEHQLDRQSVIVALGGGVVGDIAGFVASTYMRGIPFVQIPTTVLAQNDSSVGGKVGVDFHNHKNMIGAFYQPRLVYMNTTVLNSLPKREFASGMSEVIKHGLIQDKAFYSYIFENVLEIQSIDHNIISEMNFISCNIKGYVVGKDEKEQSLRKILNYGHTIGHAIETLSNFEYLHGECVSLGMLAAAYISLKRNMLTKDDFNSIEKLLQLYDLPIKLPILSAEDIYEQMFYDKKVLNDTVIFILLSGIGSCIEVNDVTKEEIINSIEYLQKACL